MKIGIDIRLIGKKRTGDEVVFFNLVRSFAQIDTDHNFKLFTDITDPEVLKEISRNLGIVGKKNFEIISLATKNKFTWNFWTLQKYLKKNPVDIYHTQYITPFFVPRSVKIVTIIHDISFNFFPQYIKKSDLFFLKTLIPLSLKRADKIVGVSEFTCNEIKNYYKIDADKVECITNAVSDDFLAQEITLERKKEVKDKYKLPDKFILYVGTLQPRKNIAQLIEAFARIKGRVGDVKLVICGNKQAHNFDSKINLALEKHNLLGEISFPGFIEENDKAAVFSLAHIFVFPSLYEGFGIPVLEAMSQGVPVLCNDIGSLREIAGEAALFVDTSNLDKFSNILYDICIDNDLRMKLIQSGEERIGFFSWKKSAGRTIALYEKMFHNK
jgi:glycosyltransferase involved in cell wall biosynthesis